MTSNPYEAPSTPVVSFAELGDAVFECRERSEMEKMVALGQSQITVHIQIVFFSFMMLIFTVAAISQLGGLQAKPTPEIYFQRQVIGGLIFLGYLVAWYWYVFRKPRRGSLVYHEHGIRFKKKAYRFTDIASMQSGRKRGSIESALISTNRFMGKFKATNRHAAEINERANDASVTIALKNSTTACLKAVAIRCQPDDLGRFLKLIAERRPEIQLQLGPIHRQLVD